MALVARPVALHCPSPGTAARHSAGPENKAAHPRQLGEQRHERILGRSRPPQWLLGTAWRALPVSRSAACRPGTSGCLSLEYGVAPCHSPCPGAPSSGSPSRLLSDVAVFLFAFPGLLTNSPRSQSALIPLVLRSIMRDSLLSWKPPVSAAMRSCPVAVTKVPTGGQQNCPVADR
jgi:hypothetical protein